MTGIQSSSMLMFAFPVLPTCEACISLSWLLFTRSLSLEQLRMSSSDSLTRHPDIESVPYVTDVVVAPAQRLSLPADHINSCPGRDT